MTVSQDPSGPTERPSSPSEGEAISAIYSAALAGQLAGGVAHFFNNLLGGMLGFVTLAPTLEAPVLAEFCARLQQQIEEASSLTRLLLSIARRKNAADHDDVCELSARTLDVVRLARTAAKASIMVEAKVPDRSIWSRISPLDYTLLLLEIILAVGEPANETDVVEVSIDLKSDREVCTLVIEDNGPAWELCSVSAADLLHDSTVLTSPSVALNAARELVERAGGSFEVGAGHLCGNRTTVTLPAGVGEDE